MIRFVWLNDSYRVNIDSIFSLQRIKRDESDEHARWQEAYDIITGNIQDEFHDVLEDPTKTDQQKIDEVTLEIKKLVGPEPDKWDYEYIVITQTGLKISITKDKYDLLNKIIDDIDD